MQREGEAQNRVGANLGGRSAGDPRASTATPDHERRAGQGREHVDPGCVEPSWCLGDLATTYPPRLLDEDHPPAGCVGGVPSGQQVDRLDTASCSVAEDEQTLTGAAEVHAGSSDGGLDLR